jgi:hypothetical protein
MEFTRWQPKREYSKQEQFLMKRLTRTRRLFGFLRELRHELFDDEFQAQLESMYRSSGAGKPPHPPALLAMVVLLQAYHGISDAEAVELSVVDLRWQMVLDRLGSTEPAFSQGALSNFRGRLIHHDMDQRLLERTVEIARRSNGFDWKKLPKTVRVAMDSSPLEGAGRVEDTINLLAHAARNVLKCAAMLLDRPLREVARQAGAPLLLGSSIKRELDLDWSDPAQKRGAIVTLVEQLDALERWIAENLPTDSAQPPLAELLATLRQLRDQDIEPDPSSGGPRIRRGVAPDRRVSVEDPDMRHGRKSKSKRFNGFKRHIAADLDTELILACAVTPANRPEEQAAPQLHADIARLPQRAHVQQLHIDRGYITSSTVDEILANRGEVVCRPWVHHNNTLFSKRDFAINMRDRTITCPAGKTERFTTGTIVEFDPRKCSRCAIRFLCTTAAHGSGRTVNIGENEQLQHRLRKLTAGPGGRARLRERVTIEHRLAHISQKQGHRARYRGLRKNLFDLRRSSAVLNLETIHRRELAAAA